MSKLYYTDPLAAAYMAREFAVMLRTPCAQNIAPSGMLEHWHELLKVNPKLNLDRIYIHPDSLSIFEPKLHDLVEWEGLVFGFVIGLNEGEVGVQHGESDVYTLDKDECTIIQRDDKPFFYPDSED